MAFVVERRENHPKVADKGPHDADCQEIQLPPETRRMLAEVHGSGLWRSGLSERARYATIYLLA